MDELKNLEGKKSINSTDSECVKVKSRQGIHAGYNSQIVVDEKAGLIVSSDVVAESNDVNQFAEQIEQANETLGKKCKNACGDAGYADTAELKKIDEQNINVIVPNQKQAHNRETKPFEKEQFQYDEKNDSYRCPEGHKLTYTYFDKDKDHRVYQISDKAVCSRCNYFGICTTSNHGRRIRRLTNEETKLKLAEQYKKEESQDSLLIAAMMRS